MSRSVKKGPFVEPKLYQRICEMNEKGEKRVLKTWSRASVILPEYVGHTIAVQDGKTHAPVSAVADMVGHTSRDTAVPRHRTANKRKEII